MSPVLAQKSPPRYARQRLLTEELRTQTRMQSLGSKLSTARAVFAEREIIEYRLARGLAYFALIFAARITLPHFSISKAICFPNSSGVFPTVPKPGVAMRSFISAKLIISMIWRCRRATISFEVPLGTSTPNQFSPKMSGYPASAIVGTWGSVCNRAAPNTASARSFPSWTCGTVATGATMEIGVWPPIVEPIAKPALPKGTCTRSTPYDTRNGAPTRCPGDPTPPEAKLYRPGLFLARATRSCTVLVGSDG